MPVNVKFGSKDLRRAALVGIDRRIQAIRLGLHNKHGYNDAAPWQLDIEGSLAEAAVAVALGIPFDGKVDNFKHGGDLGERIQVRSSEKQGRRLLVREDDRDGDVFVYVTGRAPCYQVVGWITGAEAKRVGSLENPGNRDPAWFVSRKDLHPIETLREALCS